MRLLSCQHGKSIFKQLFSKLFPPSFYYAVEIMCLKFPNSMASYSSTTHAHGFLSVAFGFQLSAKMAVLHTSQMSFNGMQILSVIWL